MSASIALSHRCETNGLAEGAKCSACGEIIIAQDVIPALGHTHETVTGKSVTCTEDGVTDGVKCSVCDKVIVEQTPLSALGHAPAEAVKENIIEATETTKESYELVVYCSACGDEISRDTVIIPTLSSDVDNTENDEVGSDAEGSENTENSTDADGVENAEKPNSVKPPKTADCSARTDPAGQLQSLPPNEGNKPLD